MNWEAISAIGEWIGAIAVIATLIYLAIQVRHTKHELKLLGMQTRGNTAIDVLAPIVNDPEIASLLLKMGHPRFGDFGLEAVEAQRIGAWCHMWMQTQQANHYLLLAKVNSRDTETVIKALIKQSKKLPKELYKSLTWDRGKELAGHKEFSLATNIKVYFCDPKSPWQRGSNENTNGLLRQYFPKRTDLSVHSQAHLNKVARQLNERPRKTLGFRTPAQKFNECVASTV